MNVLLYIDIIIFILTAFSVIYLLFFSLASLFRKVPQFPDAETQRKIAVLIPAYREENVILDTVNAALKQEYPKDKFDIIVISDRMPESMNRLLGELPVILIKMPEEENTKAKAMRIALQQTGSYDIVAILDADNICSPHFLKTINNAFAGRYRALQAHRCAKNTEKTFAILDAISEEINNTIFRKGHAAVGFPPALIGSGMAFEYGWFKKHIDEIHSTGEDKELEYWLLKEKIRTAYIDNEFVLDEKVSKSGNFYNQRRRWLSAQFYHLKDILPQFPQALKTGNIALCNKIVQMMLLPRVILLGFTLTYAIVISFISMAVALKWWILFGMLMLSLGIATPRKLVNKKLFLAIPRLPVAFVLMFLNLFRIKGGSKKFIHTRHG